jgi:glycosyltransferase involved in cell wall biosynthesis
MSRDSQTNRNLICISPINWDDAWEGPQEITSQFAAAGWQVLFVENMGGRTPRFTWHDATRAAHRLKRLLWKPEPTVAPPSGVTIHTPYSLPPYQLPAIHSLNRTLLTKQLRKRLNTLGWKRPRVWTYNPSRLVLDICSALHASQLVYFCTSDYTKLSPQHAPLVEDEKEMIRAADLVFVVPRQLLAEKRALSSRVHPLPQGANLQHYRMHPASAVHKSELGGLPRPVIGYIGTIHEWVDQELLCFIAKAKPEWTFVLIGPERVNTRALRQMPNVRLLGFRPHDLLPQYLADFDVGIIPYVTKGFGQMTRPNKVLEYLVMGKPVVTTALPELHELSPHLFSADSAPQFVHALELALASDSPDKQRRRRETAIANSMDERFAELEQLLLDNLREKAGTSAAQPVA